MPDYQKGKIYKILCNITGLTYYGSTTQALSVRMGGHRIKFNCSSKHIILGGDYDYSLVEDCPCENKEQLHRRERYYIENNECVNAQIPGRTDKEYQKEYRKKNRDKLLAQQLTKVTCECGSVTVVGNLAKHKRTKKHQAYLESQK